MRRVLGCILLFLPGWALADDPLLPDHRLTPGAILAVSSTQVCVSGYAKRVRNVAPATKQAAYRRYGLKRSPGHYEVDHLISLELGGSNSILNLWPQSYQSMPWNAHVKDHLENFLHTEVCAGRVTLGEAQHQIAADWIAAYQHFIPATQQPVVRRGMVFIGRKPASTVRRVQ